MNTHEQEFGLGAAPVLPSGRGADSDLLRGKVIVVLSPQSWGTMRISKHHYAVALARRGNRVFFINPPQERHRILRPRFELKSCRDAENLWLVDHQLGFPYRLKFHAARLFRAGMQLHTRALLAALPEKPDAVWSFDLSRTYSLLHFGNDALKIFHPVDEPSGPNAIRAAAGSDAIFSVTNEILARYEHATARRTFINHGLSDEFVSLAQVPPTQHEGTRIGLSGNFLRQDLDYQTILTIIREHRGCTFECWGSVRDNNISGPGTDASRTFVRALQNESNVIIHGAVSPKELSCGYRRMDAFLICYDIDKDQSHGTNYHKIMEFLAAGHVIVSNNITTYATRPDLVQMIAERASNRTLPALFRDVLAQLPIHNSASARRVRQEFALDNTYERQLARISAVLSDELRAKARPVCHE